MTDDPTFSVIVPVYNDAVYVRRALESVRAQTDPDLEVVVVNDGSTDATPDVVDEFARRDDRIRVFHKPNGGVSSALNRGIREARGRWVCWLSSDDEFVPGRLAILREWIASHPECRFFFNDFCRIGPDGEELPDEPWGKVAAPDWQVIEMLRGTFINGICICVRADVFDAAGAFDEKNKYGQDYDMLLRLLTEARATHVPLALSRYRCHPSQGMQQMQRVVFCYCATAAIRHLNHFPLRALLPVEQDGDEQTRLAILDRCLDVAFDQHAFLYAAGAHPALAMRIAEWIGRTEDRGARARMRRRFLHRARSASRAFRGSNFGDVWRAIALGCEVAPTSAYETVAPEDVVTLSAWSRRNLPHQRRSAQAYLGLDDSESSNEGGRSRCAFVDGTATRAPSEAQLDRWSRDGHFLVVLREGSDGICLNRRGMEIRTRHRMRSFFAAASLAPWDAVVCEAATPLRLLGVARQDPRQPGGLVPGCHAWPAKVEHSVKFRLLKSLGRVVRCCP